MLNNLYSFDIIVAVDTYCVFMYSSGHTKGLSPLAGEHIEFCSDDNRQVYNDPKVIRTID